MKRFVIVLLATLIISVGFFSLTRAGDFPLFLKEIKKNNPVVDIPSSNQSISEQETANAAEVKSLMDLWRTKTIEYESWTHVVAVVSSEQDNGVLLPNGSPLASTYLQDDWYYINDKGLVERGVFTMRDFDGNILQQSAFSNGVTLNLTFDMRTEGQQPYEFKLDFGFVDQVKYAENLGVTIKKIDVEGGDKTSTVFIIDEALETPILLSNSKGEVERITTKGFFDKETGNFLQFQIIWSLVSGEEMVFNSTEIKSIESGLLPPEEILISLEEAK